MFVDEAKIFVKGGDGGKGCVSFYRSKQMRFKKPDGGDGGNGGDVIFVASKSMQTLLDYRYKQHYVSFKGGNASSQGKRGRDGKDSVLRVPVGTIIKDFESDLVLQDLTKDGQTFIVAHGGRGGVGNENDKLPHPPIPGEEKIIKLELKVIADVGFVGFPNVGKSTLICGISKVKSKIANYPFTTKSPILGIVSRDSFADDKLLDKIAEETFEFNDFIVADLPGLIEGAHQGKGLGDRFLKHAERTKILVHIIDMAATEGRNPIEDFQKITKELQQYSKLLYSKHKILVANKMDLPEAKDNLKKFKRKIKKEIIEVSALEHQGLSKLVNKIREILWQENSQEELSE